MQLALNQGTNSSETELTFHTLLGAKADPHQKMLTGSSTIHQLGMHPAHLPNLLQLLLDEGLDVNLPQAPQTFLWRLLLPVFRCAVQLGSRNPVFLWLAPTEGRTPLMLAVEQKRCDVRTIFELLKFRADPHMRNKQGYTALDMARREFGAVPILLERLLTQAGALGTSDVSS